MKLIGLGVRTDASFILAPPTVQLSFQEHNTSAYIRAQLDALGIPYTYPLGVTGIRAVLSGEAGPSCLLGSTRRTDLRVERAWSRRAGDDGAGGLEYRCRTTTIRP